MKALSLWEPWAGLVAAGEKTVETRGWATSYRGELAIAATARAGGWRVWSDLSPEIREAWLRSGRDLCHGHVVATCVLVDVIPVDRVRFDEQATGWRTDGLGDLRAVLPSAEEPLGDYSAGRYAWLLDDIEPLAEPVPARGRQQLWEWAAA